MREHNQGTPVVQHSQYFEEHQLQQVDGNCKDKGEEDLHTHECTTTVNT